MRLFAAFPILLVLVSPVSGAVIKGKVSAPSEKKAIVANSYSRGVFEPKIKSEGSMENPAVGQPASRIVIWAEPVGSVAPFKQPDQKPLMNQKNKAFVPDLLVVQTGTTVGFPNLDPLYHNVFSYSKAKRFDLGRYKQGTSKEVTFPEEGVVEVFCEIHENMHAYIVVVNTPYFAIADKNGAFSIRVPPGKYSIRAWSPNRESEIVQTDVSDTEDTTVNFSF